MNFAQTLSLTCDTPNLTVSTLACSLPIGARPFTAAHRDAIASALEGGHCSRYLLLAYAILDDQWGAVFLHRAADDLSGVVCEWHDAIARRMQSPDVTLTCGYQINAESVIINDLSQIYLIINNLISFALRKPYVDDHYRWIRVMPLTDDLDLPPIGFTDDWRNWSRATPVPSIMRGIFAPNGEPSSQRKLDG